MTDPAPTSTWAVVCRNWVHRCDTEAEADAYLKAIKGLQCKADHQITFTNLPAGSRLERGTK